ncbi:MAG: type II toxin-antitoxin system RelE/ParE family toxin [Phormidesmis sp.]
MNSENGSPNYEVSLSPKFARAIKVLKKKYKSKREAKAFVEAISDIVEELAQFPEPKESRQEPWPSNLNYAEWNLRKLTFPLPGRSGAVGQGRLIYLVNDQLRIIHLLWPYTHEEFDKRPPDKDLKSLIQEFIDEYGT